MNCAPPTVRAVAPNVETRSPRRGGDNNNRGNGSNDASQKNGPRASLSIVFLGIHDHIFGQTARSVAIAFAQMDRTAAAKSR